MMWDGPELLDNHQVQVLHIGGAHGIWWARLISLLIAVLFLVLAMTAGGNDPRSTFAAASGPAAPPALAVDP